MSIVRCKYCNKGIDTDFDDEHFIEDTEDCVLQADQKEEITNDLDELFKHLNDPL